MSLNWEMTEQDFEDVKHLLPHSVVARRLRGGWSVLMSGSLSWRFRAAGMRCANFATGSSAANMMR